MDQTPFSFESLPDELTEKFNQLTALLVQENQKHNLTRIIDQADVRIRHYLDSLIALDIIDDLAEEDDLSIIDIGSGPGFPGLPIAIASPASRVVSVDATGKKINFQKLAVSELGLQNFEPIHARAEELARDRKYREQFDFVVSRAVGQLPILLELCLPFLKPNGFFLVWKGQKTEEEIEKSQNAFDVLSADIADVIPYNLTGPDDNFNIVVIQKAKPTPAKYPRLFKNIKQAPL